VLPQKQQRERKLGGQASIVGGDCDHSTLIQVAAMCGRPSARPRKSLQIAASSAIAHNATGNLCLRDQENES
jgi:hypothetical protein